MSVTGIFEGTTPLVQDRYLISAIAGAAITMGQVVSIATTSSAVYPPIAIPTPNAYAANVMGIALGTQVSGQVVTVVARGVCRVITDGTAVTAGDLLVTSSAYIATVKTLPPITNALVSGLLVNTNSGYVVSSGFGPFINNYNSTVIGKALTTAAAVSGSTIYILFEP